MHATFPSLLLQHQRCGHKLQYAGFRTPLPPCLPSTCYPDTQIHYRTPRDAVWHRKPSH